VEPVEITAGSLHLRPFAAADEDAVLAICQDPEIGRWTRVPTPYTAADAHLFVTQTAPKGWAEDREYSFAVCAAVGGSLLASIGLRPRRTDAVGDVGFWCRPEARRQGVMSQATAAVCRWGFEALGLARIEWCAAIGNDASRRVAEKVGFTIEGVLRSRLDLHGVRHDAWIGSLLPTDMSERPSGANRRIR
jgi:RimJ/RimL family protein N-acetyltransferase